MKLVVLAFVASMVVAPAFGQAPAKTCTGTQQEINQCLWERIEALESESVRVSDEIRLKVTTRDLCMHWSDQGNVSMGSCAHTVVRNEFFRVDAKHK
jgi:hypothetical protein